MTQPTPLPRRAAGFGPPWSWCARCQRAYQTGSCRLIRFTADALHPHPASLHLCPYDDCCASTLRDGWRWATIQREHPDYPPQPERNVVYVRGEMDSSQAHDGYQADRSVQRSAPTDQEWAALKDEPARAFKHTTPGHRHLVGWEDDGGSVAAAAERAPQ